MKSDNIAENTRRLTDLNRNMLWEVLRYHPEDLYCVEILNKTLALRISQDESYIHYFLEDLFQKSCIRNRTYQQAKKSLKDILQDKIGATFRYSKVAEIRDTGAINRLTELKHAREQYEIQMLNDRPSCVFNKEQRMTDGQIFADYIIYEGKHTWDIHIDEQCQVDEWYIGVCNTKKQWTRNLNSSWPFDFYTYCASGDKLSKQENYEGYAQSWGEGDVITVHIKFLFGRGILRFAKNGIDQGVSYKNLRPPLYPMVYLDYRVLHRALSPN